MDIKINNVQQNSFTGGLKSLNFINPAAYYANRYFRNSAKLSKQKYDVIMPELIQNVYVRYFKSGGKRICAWDINPKNSEQYVLFLHGMAQNVSNYQRLYTQILDKKFGVFALEYRGYGNNKTCFLSEDALRKDVNTAFKYLVKEKGVKPENIIVMGHSVGGTLAAHLASKQKNIKSLILISPIASLKYTGDKFNRSKVLGLGMPEDLCKFVNFSKVLSWLSNLRFNSFDKIKKVTAPTYILQSKNDTVTPITPARKLVKIAKRQGILKEFRSFPLGGHKLDSNKINTIGEILDKINAGNL